MQPIYYHLSNYISHHKAGILNKQALLAAGLPLTERSEEAEIVIVHDDPILYAPLLHRQPHWQHCKKIAYAVWETEDLPVAYATALQRMDAVWTCSDFAQQAIMRGLAAPVPVHLVPHVVNPVLATAQDMDTVRQCLPHDPQAFYFYTIADSYNPRKNILRLLNIFAKNFAQHKHVYLVIKQYRKALDLSGLPQVCSIDAELTESQIVALHQLCHCYVSAHTCEAWGLALSDALALGKPLIATGYSGNMQYMTPRNSFPVRYSMEPVPILMCRMSPLFSPDMRWAAVDGDHMGYLMQKVLRAASTAQGSMQITAMAQEARTSMQAYTPLAVGTLMRRLLAQL